jgi:emp24/gp25L/p24 family/GOLD
MQRLTVERPSCPEMAPFGRPTPPQCITFAYLLFSALAAARVCSALQFDLLAGKRRCFYERIAPDTRVRVGLIVIAGSGQLPVSLRIARPALREVVYERDATSDGEKFSFQTLPLANRQVTLHLPPIPSPDPKIEWHARIGDMRHVQHTAHSKNCTGTGKLASTAFPSNATSTVEQSLTGLGNYITEPEQSIYSFCFETPKQRPTGRFLKIARAAHMRTRTPLRRRLLFDLSVGNASQTPPTLLADLAKEQHVNDSEALFKAIRGRVLSLLVSLENMHVQAKSTDKLASSTSVVVSFWSMLSCVFIVASAICSGILSSSTIDKHKRA